MIFDQLAHIKAYQGISRNLDTAIAFITSHNLQELPMGRTEINGTQVFLNKMAAETAPETAKQYEVHKKYMDIQIDIEGTELILIGLDGFHEKEPFSPEKDFGSCTAEKSARLRMGPGRFVVCMAQEPHLPSAAANEDRRLKKCVIKVAVED